MITIRNLCKSYSHVVLNNISFSIQDGTICGLFGVNGAGKSTLMKIITSLEEADSGEVFWNGEKIQPGKPIIGSMIESPCFLPGLSGRENLCLLARLAGDCPEKDVLTALTAVGLEKQKDVAYRRYSLGMKQRLYFAFAIMRKPKLLILDEPFNGIDPIALDLFEKIIQGFAQSGAVVLISSHEIRELQALVNQAIFLDQGKIIYENQDAQKIDIFQEFLSRVHSSGEAQ
jgi:ABC-type multidrug transport system ATPase subunit